MIQINWPIHSQAKAKRKTYSSAKKDSPLTHHLSLQFLVSHRLRQILAVRLLTGLQCMFDNKVIRCCFTNSPKNNFYQLIEEKMSGAFAIIRHQSPA